MDFADRLRQARKDSGMTQKELAARVGMNYRLISRYEQGTMEPSVGRAIKMAEVLGFSPYDKPSASIEAVVGGHENDLEMMRDDYANLQIRYARLQNDISEVSAELKAEQELHTEMQKRYYALVKQLQDVKGKSYQQMDAFRKIAFNLYIKR